MGKVITCQKKESRRLIGEGWNDHAEKFFDQMVSLEGVRLPGQRRHKNRNDLGSRKINKELVEKIKSLSD